MKETAIEERDREKSHAALSSLWAAVVLTLLKLIVGLSTNSLGVLSEAAHSGFDLVAAAVTFFAVRYAANPADAEHPYGHGKIENLSALIEALLLLVTCVWIIWEAIDRLFFSAVQVTPSVWALLVMGVSIGIDFTRSRILMRAAKKYNSQALEADALHFSTDIWSSGVVIVGLIALYAASLFPKGSMSRFLLEHADAAAALGVSFIIIHVSVSLARKAVNVLLDAGDTELSDNIFEKVLALPDVQSVRRLRLRRSGADSFVDLSVCVDGGVLLKDTEVVRHQIELVVLSVLPEVDLTLEVIPEEPVVKGALTFLRQLAALHGLEIHAIEFLNLDYKDKGEEYKLLQLHVEVNPALTLKEAHAIVTTFEEKALAAYPGVTIVSNIEPQEERYYRTDLLEGDAKERVERAVTNFLAKEADVQGGHDVVAWKYGEGIAVSFHCYMAPSSSVTEAYSASLRIQETVQKCLPEVRLALVHMEPLEENK